MRWGLIICLSFLLSIPAGHGLAQQATNPAQHPDPPKLPFIRKPACPFEGCMYGKWVLKAPTTLFESPRYDSNVIAQLNTNDPVEALTGEIHTTRYGEIKVLKRVKIHSNEGELEFKAGDILYDMEEFGEGEHSIWFQGRIYIIRAGWITANSWMPDEFVWGKMTVERITDWWVRIRVPSSGISGWIVNPRADGNDRFG